MEIEVAGGTISPGDMILVGSGYGFDLGFYRGKGRGTLQYYVVKGFALAVEKKMKKYPWPISRVGGYYANQRIIRYSPDLVTDVQQRTDLEMALEFIRETNILPVKY